MRIIDYTKKGNIVRFYLGEKTKEHGWTNADYFGDQPVPEWLKYSEQYYGDDWDDRPYEHNAGKVYDEFIKGHKDLAFGFDDLVLEPCDSYVCNSIWCKDDMKDRAIPCIIVVPKEVRQDSWEDAFDYWVNKDDARIKKFYFGDEMEKE